MKKNRWILFLLIILLLLIGFGLWKYKSPSKTEKHESKNNQLEDKDVQKSIFKDSYEKARTIVNQMTLEEKVGQLFLVRYDASKTEEYATMYPGGYILFAKDFEPHTKESIKKELETLQNNNTYKLILGVDEEGGFVTRVSRYPNFRKEKFQSPKYYYEQGGYELLEKTEREKASLLKQIGINLNLAPVADISTNEEDFIYNRSFGKGAEETSEFIAKMVSYAKEEKMNSCLKHFPGYGNNKDTHTGIAIDNRDYEEFQKNDYLPFKKGIEAGAPSILVSHNIITCLDANHPASLSKKLIQELRETLQFTGIVMTDDLAMDAVKEYVEDRKAATMAINAGNDMIITSDFENMYQEVMNSVKEEIIPMETLNKAVIRIMSWKYDMGLL